MSETFPSPQSLLESLAGCMLLKGPARSVDAAWRHLSGGDDSPLVSQQSQPPLRGHGHQEGRGCCETTLGAAGSSSWQESGSAFGEGRKNHNRCDVWTS